MIPREITAADLVKARNARQGEADRWRAANPGDLSDELRYRIGQWIEQGGERPFGEPESRVSGGHVYPPIARTQPPAYPVRADRGYPQA
jgi:hypothetical protein